MDQLLLEKALINLDKNTGVRTDWEKCVTGLNREIDARLVLHWNNIRIERYAKVKKEIRAHHIPQLKELAKKYGNFLLVVERLYPTIKDKLNQEGLDWLDEAGNVHIKDNNLLLWIDHHTTTPTEKKKNRAFTKTGLKVVYLFLAEQEWLNKTHREIANRADVALGNIKLVFNGLEQQGFLIQIDEKRKKLTKKAELMDQWIAGFIDELKPKIYKGNYRFRRKELELEWKDLKLTEKAVWGGEPGADLLTNNLKPKQYLIYTHLAKAELMKKFGLVPDKDGPIEVYEPYWKMEDGTKQVAPPLTVYFDLKVTGEARNTKLAQDIYERFLEN